MGSICFIGYMRTVKLLDRYFSIHHIMSKATLCSVSVVIICLQYSSWQFVSFSLLVYYDINSPLMLLQAAGWLLMPQFSKDGKTLT